MDFQFATLVDFLTMNGHGGFVWFSYAITTIVLIILAVLPYQQKKQLAKQLHRQQRINRASTAEE